MLRKIKNFDTSIAVFLLFLALISAESEETGPCCNFEQDTCNLFNAGWMWTSEHPITALHSIPSYSTGNQFMYANESGSQLFTSTIHVPRSTVYSFKYYIDSSYDYVSGKFRRESDGVIIDIIEKPSYQYQLGDWDTVYIDFSKCDECCGWTTCDGQIIIQYVGGDYYPDHHLAAVDNFGLENLCTQQFPEPTLPPPTSHKCCYFDTDICDFTLFDWNWSAQHKTNYSIPEFSGDYLWSTTFDPNSQIVSGMQYAVDYNTRFNFKASSGGLGGIYFRETVTGKVSALKDYEMNPCDTWYSFSYVCNYDCCERYPCDGQLILRFSEIGSYVDIIGRDDACEEAMPCCLFDDETICNFTSTSDGEYTWKSILDATPINPPPSPESQYMFFETVNYTGSEVLKVVLESPSFTVKNNSQFSGGVFIRNNSQQNPNNTFLISFYNDNTETTVDLAYGSDTHDTWAVMQFSCYRLNCCPDGPTCTGKLQITVNVDTNGGSIFVGVDALESNYWCSNFPDYRT